MDLKSQIDDMLQPAPRSIEKTKEEKPKGIAL